MPDLDTLRTHKEKKKEETPDNKKEKVESSEKSLKIEKLSQEEESRSSEYTKENTDIPKQILEKKEAKIEEEIKPSSKKQKKKKVKKKKEKSYSRAYFEEKNYIKRFEKAVDFISKNREKIFEPFPEYFGIDLLMLAIYKPACWSCTRNENLEYQRINLKNNLIKRYNLSDNYISHLETLIDKLFSLFEDKFAFDLFNLYRTKYRETRYMNILYNKFEELIHEKITGFAQNLNELDKKILWLLDYTHKSTYSGYYFPPKYLDLQEIVLIGTLIFSIENLNEDIVREILIKIGIAHNGQYISDNGNFQERDVIYPFWKEIPIFQPYIEEINNNIPDFKEALEKFSSDFSLNLELNNIIRIIHLDFLLKKTYGVDYELKKILDQSLIEKYVAKNIPNIVINDLINPLIYDQIKALILKFRNELFLKFNWLKNYINSHEKIIEIHDNKFLINIDDSNDITMEIHLWYSEEIVIDENKIIILLYHPNIEFLKESLFEQNLIAFRHNKDVYFSGTNENYEILSSLLELIENQGYKVFRRIIPSKKELFLELLEEGEAYDKKVELDSFFPSEIPEQSLSSLFTDSIMSPKLILYHESKHNTGIKIIEDLIEEEFKFWGLNIIKTYKHRRLLSEEDYRRDIREDYSDVIKDNISNPNIRLISIQADNPGAYDLNELLLNIQQSGLRYLLINTIRSFNDDNQINFEELTNIPYTLITFPNNPVKLKKLLNIYGKNFSSQPYFETFPLDISWNKFIVDLKKNKDHFKNKIFNTPEVIENVPIEPSESDSHYILKGIVYLNLKQGENIERIEIEKELPNERIRPDLKFIYKGEEIVVEIETGYPTTEELRNSNSLLMDPIKRLRDKLLKYKNSSRHNLILVISNTFYLLHTKQIRNLKRYFIAQKIFNKVGVYSIDWSKFPFLIRWNI